jgi:hypothetical protein
MAMSRRAALKVYTSKNFEGRGEFGEIMLHAVIRQEFDTHPAISKIFFKDRANDYVKGFDCVHVSTNDQGGLDLWLGEAKFYVRRGQAIAAVAKDLASTSPATSCAKSSRSCWTRSTAPSRLQISSTI